MVCVSALHPRFKFEYFRRQRWEQEWITTAETILRQEWERGYKPKVPVSVEDGTQAPTASVSQQNNETTVC